jgi:exonuclease III
VEDKLLIVITWNVARRKTKVKDQVAYLVSQSPDVIALQEVTPAVLDRMKPQLFTAGWRFQVDSLTAANSKKSNRSYGVLIASRTATFEAAQADVPWPEKVLTRLINSSQGQILFTTAYIPPGSSNGWTKIETIEGVVSHKLGVKGKSRILCGDFNCPQIETKKEEVVTWAQVISDKGIRTKKRIRNGDGIRWDAAERSLFLDLSKDGMKDVFRQLHGFEREASSWHFRNKGRDIPRRFDHMFSDIPAISCDYDHKPRLEGLSDHAPLICRFRTS